MKPNQRKSHKGLKIVLSIFLGFFVLSTIAQLWPFYILIGAIFLVVRLKRRNTHLKTAEAKPEVSYQQKDKSNMSLIVLTIICPPVGLIKISRYRKAWIEKTKITVPIISWTFVWFLILGFVTHLPAVYTHQAYKSNVQTVNLSEHEERERDNSVAIPEAPADSTDNANQSSNSASSDGSSASSQSQHQTDAGGVMAGIATANPESVPYDRKSYQPNWSVGGGCDIRSRLLTAVSIIAVSYSSNGCTVINGSWNEPYTGTVFSGNPYRGDDGTANDLDIDHIIPLNYVNSHGGYHWPDSQKRAYGASITAMNNGVYVAVSASENRKKSDSGPSTYYPPNPAYRCSYSEKWRNTARTYKISLSPADYNLIASILASCGVS